VREAEGQRRANRRLRGLFGVAVLLLVAAATAGAIVLVERAHARQQAIAAVAESLGAQALDVSSPDKSLLLAREGVNLDDSPETRSNLLAALLRSPDLIGVAHTDTGPLFDDALSPDGRLLAYRDRDGGVYLVSTSSLRRLVGPFYAGTDLDVLDAISRPLTDLAFSPDRRTLAIGSTQASPAGAPTQAVIFLYDIHSHSHSPQQEFFGLGSGATADVLFAPDGRTLVAGKVNSGKEVVFLCRASDGQPLARSQRIPAGRVIGFVDGGRELLVTSGALRSLLLDAHTLRSVRTLDEGGAAAVSGNGDLAAFGGAHGSIVLVNLRTGERTTMQERATSAAIESLAFSPDGKVLASTAADGSVAVWDVPTATLRETFAGHTAPAFDPVFSPNGKTLYAGSADGTVLAWDVSGRRSLGTTFRFAAASVPASSAVAVSPDSSLFATSPAPDRITIWRSRDEMVVGKLRGPVGSVKSLAFSHDGRFLAAVGTSPSIVVWNILRRKVVVLRQPGPPADARGMRSSAVAFAPNDRLVASAANDGVQVFSWPSRRFLGTEMSGGRSPDLAFSADSRLLASAAPSDGVLVVWHLQRPTPTIYTYHIGTPFDSLEFAPQGTTIAAGDGLGNVNFFNAATGHRLPQQIAGQNGAVLSLSFDPTGHRLMTTSSDGKIRLWNLATEKLIGTPLPGSNSRGQGTFFPNGKRLIAVFPSGAGIIWNVDPASWKARACQVAGHNLSRTEWRQYVPNVPYHKVCA
jgi:WD40 repeat protein